jgi:hypothetical protein
MRLLPFLVDQLTDHGLLVLLQVLVGLELAQQPLLAHHDALLLDDVVELTVLFFHDVFVFFFLFIVVLLLVNLLFFLVVALGLGLLVLLTKVTCLRRGVQLIKDVLDLTPKLLIRLVHQVH